MRRVSIRVRFSSVLRFVLGGSIFLSAISWSCAANAQATSASAQTTTQVAPPAPTPLQNPTYSPYSIDSKSTPLLIQYSTNRNSNSGVSSLDKAILPSDPSKSPQIKINWTSASGVPATCGIVVDFVATYKGVTFDFTTPVTSRSNGSFMVDVKDFETALIAALNNRLPYDFDPNTQIALDGPVKVLVTPIIPTCLQCPTAQPAPPAAAPPAAAPPAAAPPAAAPPAAAPPAAAPPAAAPPAAAPPVAAPPAAAPGPGDSSLGTQTGTSNDLTIILQAAYPPTPATTTPKKQAP